MANESLGQPFTDASGLFLLVSLVVAFSGLYVYRKRGKTATSTGLTVIAFVLLDASAFRDGKNVVAGLTLFAAVSSIIALYRS
ncbi:hypothetical protein [Natrinema sp. 1APR25-10V2]|uniref:hypothetical protein n=1 Tax=Natrinema sp. 1APR25-10V2 TaxID=2951081 RepID=UPI00287718C2|nr:hypothetical protein [Natrinema sp. 1APR25-10V2]MDS0476330.1 hypothetical protein [Natrinema sp. 1APR25-10V2]